jgi:hypothetical protein
MASTSIPITVGMVFGQRQAPDSDQASLLVRLPDDRYHLLCVAPVSKVRYIAPYLQSLDLDLSRYRWVYDASANRLDQYDQSETLIGSVPVG